jgi:hypothetical protein
MAEDQQLPQNDGNNDNDNANIINNNDDESDNKGDDEDNKDYTPLSDSEKEKMYHDANEIKTSRNEASIPTGRLWDLLGCIDITTALEFRIKRVPHPGREEYRAAEEIFNGPNVINRHMGLAFRESYRDVVVDAAWHAITAYNHTHHDKLDNSIYHLLPHRKKDKFKTSGVKADVPRIDMVHH